MRKKTYCIAPEPPFHKYFHEMKTYMPSHLGAHRFHGYTNQILFESTPFMKTVMDKEYENNNTGISEL